jgi:hypothetical protein
MAVLRRNSMHSCYGDMAGIVYFDFMGIFADLSKGAGFV